MYRRWRRGRGCLRTIWLLARDLYEVQLYERKTRKLVYTLGKCAESNSYSGTKSGNWITISIERTNRPENRAEEVVELVQKRFVASVITVDPFRKQKSDP